MIAYALYESDNRVRRYAEALVADGWEVDAFVLSNQEQVTNYINKGVHVFGIQKRVFNEKHAVEYLIKLFEFFIRSFFKLSYMYLIKRYKVVHIHTIPDFEVFAAIVPKIFGAKILLDIHDIQPELYIAKFKLQKSSLVFKFLKLIEKSSIWFSSHVIVANHIWANRIIERSVHAKKCTVILNYPDLNVFKKGERTEMSDKPFTLLYPGTLSNHQGIDDAINAVKLLGNSVPNLIFKIYGKGTDRDRLIQIVEKLHLGNQIQFHPIVSLEEIAQIMINADVGIEPKRATEFSDEAFSTKIFEFMVLKVPVIASDTTIHKYYINDDVVEYYHAGNVEALARAIKKLHDDKVYRNLLAEKGYRFVQSYIWQNRKKEYLDLVNF